MNSTAMRVICPRAGKCISRDLEGFRVTLWGAKSRGETIAAINKSPDYLQTDYLSYTLEILEANQ